jgi:hypothetical protein
LNIETGAIMTTDRPTDRHQNSIDFAPIRLPHQAANCRSAVLTNAVRELLGLAIPDKRLPPADEMTALPPDATRSRGRNPAHGYRRGPPP